MSRIVNWIHTFKPGNISSYAYMLASATSELINLQIIMPGRRQDNRQFRLLADSICRYVLKYVTLTPQHAVAHASFVRYSGKPGNMIWHG